MWKIASLAVLIVGMYACSSATAQNGETGAPVSNDIFVKVENLNFYDASIYLRSFGQRRRLGNVTGGNTEVFKTPWFTPEIQVEVVFLAGGRAFGDRVPVMRGDTVEVTIPPGLNRLSSFIRR
jgi:hypothetical protein